MPLLVREFLGILGEDAGSNLWERRRFYILWLRHRGSSDSLARGRAPPLESKLDLLELPGLRPTMYYVFQCSSESYESGAAGVKFRDC